MQSKRRSTASTQIKRLSSMYHEVSLRQDREIIKGADVLTYSFQLLDYWQDRLRVTMGAREAFAKCDYGIMATLDAIFANESAVDFDFIVRVR